MKSWRRAALLSRWMIAFLLGGLLTACAEVRVNTIAQKAPTAKLRICTLPISANVPHFNWTVPHETFAKNQFVRVRNFLSKTGIYEVVSDSDLKEAIGERLLYRWGLERNEWELARRIGRAVHADYVLVGERGSWSIAELYWEAILLNVESGKSFGVYIPIKYRSFREDKKAEWIKAMEISLREIFVDAKEDLLATALRKRKELSLEERLEARESVPEKAEDERKAREKADLNRIAAERVAAEQAKAEAERVAREEAEKARLAAEKENVERRAREEATAKAEPEKVAVEERSKRELPPTKNRIVDMEKLKREEEQTARRPRLVVYDLQDAGDFGPVALILSEALREEIYRTGRYVIVNRENLADVMQETTFQQSGLVDENQAVHLGKGLAASQVVTGRIGALGKSSVLQAKRIDVETFGTLAVQSLKCKRGEEEDLLDRVHDMAMGLTGGN